MGRLDTIPVIIEADTPDKTAKKVSRWGGSGRVVGRGHAVLSVPRAKLGQLASDKTVRFVEGSVRLKPNCDQAHRAANLTTGRTARRSVPQTGKGVLVGVVDTGIDAGHKAFRHRGRSRIVDYLDQERDLHHQAGSNGFINLASASRSPDADGHGTHVAGIAAGNGDGSPRRRFAGVAPNADLAIVKTTFDSTDIALGIAHVFDVAEARGQPCVVNLSLGGHFGPHDGTSLIELTIDDLCDRPGRTVVVAAGNEGSDAIHASSKLSSSSGDKARWTAAFEVLARPFGRTMLGSAWVQVWSLREDDVTVTLRSPLGELFRAPRNRRTETRRRSHIVEASHQTWRRTGDDVSTFQVRTLPRPNLLQGWSIIVEERRSGSAKVGAVHAWIGDGMGRFVRGTVRSHLVGMPGTAHSAITVASYATRKAWVSRDPTQPNVNLAAINLDNVSFFSSPGPTRDNSNKPEIAAPGQYLISALSSQATNSIPDWMQIKDLPYAAMQGTSMAAPYITGAIALLMEKEPDLSWAEIKRRLIRSNMQDEYNHALLERTLGLR